MEPPPGIEPSYPDYKSGASPSMLKRLLIYIKYIYKLLVVVTRIELVIRGYESLVIPLNYTT